VKGGYTQRSAVEERVLTSLYGHVMRHVEPGDLEGLEAANERIRAAYLGLQSEDLSRQAKLHGLWDLLRSEG
jgi:hypothetical protein